MLIFLLLERFGHSILPIVKDVAVAQCTIADFPKGVNTPVSYGANIEALIAYLHTRQYLPEGNDEQCVQY